MQLVAYGAQDGYLTIYPQINRNIVQNIVHSYCTSKKKLVRFQFRTVYVRYNSYSKEYTHNIS